MHKTRICGIDLDKNEARFVILDGHGLSFELIATDVVRLNQALKLPRFLFDRLAHHQVVPAKPNLRYEFLIAVCTGPRAAHTDKPSLSSHWSL